MGFFFFFWWRGLSFVGRWWQRRLLLVESLSSMPHKNEPVGPSTSSKKDFSVFTSLVTAEREQDSFFCRDGSLFVHALPLFLSGALGSFGNFLYSFFHFNFFLFFYSLQFKCWKFLRSTFNIWSPNSPYCSSLNYYVWGTVEWETKSYPKKDFQVWSLDHWKMRVDLTLLGAVSWICSRQHASSLSYYTNKTTGGKTFQIDCFDLPVCGA